jgi:hypothetical protein
MLLALGLGIATPVAQRDQHNGLDVMVCVQEPDGPYRKVWPRATKADRDPQ